MRNVYLMVFVLGLSLIYLAGCSDGGGPSSNSVSKNGSSEPSESLNETPKVEENIVDEVNLDYLKWFQQHLETTLHTSTKDVVNSIDSYNSNDLTNTMNIIEDLINQAKSKEFSDPTGELKIIHSEYLDALSVLEKATTIGESVFLESGAIDEGQRKSLITIILNWQKELRPVVLSINPFWGIMQYSDEIASSPNPSNYTKRAEYYEAATLYQQAFADYQKASELLPESDYLKKKAVEMKYKKKPR